MNPKMVYARALILGAALFVMASHSATADDPTAVEYIPGSWVGFSQSSLGSGPVQDSFFDIFATQQHRRFMGAATLALGDGSVRFLCDGSVSQANVMNVVGRSTDGALILVMHGKTRALGDGSVRIAALFYRISDLQGNLIDAGYLLLLQRIGGINWGDLQVPAVQGNWIGSWENNLHQGRAALTVERQQGSGFGGTLSFFDVFFAPTRSFFDVFFDLRGTIGPASITDGTSNTLMIGADSHGIIAILIGLLLPAVQNPAGAEVPAVQGNYMLFRSLADVFGGVWRGTDTSFDRGGFMFLPAVQ
jgi:hypothetical protein